MADSFVPTPTASALAFDSTFFDVVMRDGEPWLRLPQIGVALGYSRPYKLQQVFSRHCREFTDSMSQVIHLPTPSGKQDVRIFSLRGAHLLAMFARTSRAAEFRRWVLDVLDREVKQPPRTPPAAVVAVPPPNQQLTRLRATEIAQHTATRVRRSVYRAALKGTDDQRRRLLVEIEPDDTGEPVVTVRHLADDVQVASWPELLEQLKDVHCNMPLPLAQELARAAAWQGYREAALCPRGRGAELASQLRREKLGLADLYELILAVMGEQSARLTELGRGSLPMAASKA